MPASGDAPDRPGPSGSGSSDPGSSAPRARFESTGGHQPRRVDDFLDRVVRGMGAPGVDAVELVFNRWEEVVGSVLATQTRPVAIDGDRLVLAAADPAVVSHVQWLEAELVQRLGELLGEGRVNGVDVRVDRRR